MSAPGSERLHADFRWPKPIRPKTPPFGESEPVSFPARKRSSKVHASREPADSDRFGEAASAAGRGSPADKDS